MCAEGSQFRPRDERFEVDEIGSDVADGGASKRGNIRKPGFPMGLQKGIQLKIGTQIKMKVC